MKRLKFSADEGSAFYKELSQEIEEYFRANKLEKSGNALMFFKMILYFSLCVAFYTLMIQSGSLISFYIFYLLMGLAVLLTAFNVSHDAAHGVAVKSRLWNKILFQLSFNLQGNNAYVWGKNHNESHHLYTNVEGSDIDVLNNPMVRMTKNQPLRVYHRYQYLYVPFLYLLYSLNWFLFRETLMMFGKSSRTIEVSIPRLEIFKLIFFKALYITYMIIIPALVLRWSWHHVLYAFLLNHAMVSLIFTAVLGVSHLSDKVVHPEPDENGKLPMSWPMLQLRTSIDYNSDSVLCNWLLGGFNAHAVHHLFPNICHVHYLKLMPLFRAAAKKHGLEYQEMPYPQALRSHFRFLKKMGNPSL